MWMELLYEYGLFLLQFATVIGGLAALAFLVAMLKMRSRAAVDGHLEVKHVNRKLDHAKLLLEAATLPKGSFKKSAKAHKEKLKKAEKSGAGDRKRMFVVNFKGDIRADEVASLREEISAILTTAGAGDEVLVILESGGGTVHGYGLGASQLRRIRDKNVALTVAVDKVAASGGYMMACVANRIIAAPFAIIGSIGVLAQVPNFHKLLKKHDIDFEQISAGKHKRTLSLVRREYGSRPGKIARGARGNPRTVQTIRAGKPETGGRGRDLHGRALARPQGPGTGPCGCAADQR